MGCLLRFNLPDELVARYPIFVETGTGLGVSLDYAAEHNFKHLTSIEYDYRLASKARAWFGDIRIRIEHGASAQILKPLLRSYREGAGFLFWLDAHWPGSDYFGDPYVVGEDRDLSLPLARELQAIADTWELHRGRFIAIIDDVSSMMMLDQGARYLFESFAYTHDTTLYMKDEGYAVIAPKGDGPRPELIQQYDIHQLVSAFRRYIEHGHWTGAGGFAGGIMALTDGGIDPPDVGAKMVARGEAARYFAAEALARQNPGTASDLFIQAMVIDPLCLDYRMDYIYQVLLPMGSRELALSNAKQATKMFPTEPRAWCALVETHRRLGNKADAIAAMAEARKLPASVTTTLLDAQFSADLAQFEDAYLLYRHIAKRHPERRGEALVGLGVAQARDGRFKDAIATFDKALEVGPPDPALCRWNRAETLLTLGRYAEGWPDHGRRFELEIKLSGTGVSNSRFRRPMWEPGMAPTSVLVQSEQGYGDVICMARYVPMLAGLGHQVQFEVDPKLVDLFRSSPDFDGVKVVPRALDYPGWFGLEGFDVHMPTMCFPAAFETGIDNVPWPGPYLTPDPKLVAQVADKWGPKGRPRVGLCWSTGRRDGIWEDEYCNQKSVPWKVLEPFVEYHRQYVEWHLFDFPTGRMVPDDTGPTFADSAAILANCDLLITVDTGMAHLGGAMGLPTWIMHHGPAGSWHWMAAEADGGRWAERSPWYPSVRLFRQERPHEWTAVIERIGTALRETFL